MILAGDIGGTKTLLGLYEIGPAREESTAFPQSLMVRSFPSQQYPTFDLVLQDFLLEAREKLAGPAAISCAAFGVAGPVVHGRCQTTNLPWILDTAHLAACLTVSPDRVALLNDLAAIAWGITNASETEMAVLNKGVPDRTGNRIVVAPGTGLGESIITLSDHGPIVLATEGGHTDWAPEYPGDVPLLSFLWSRFGHASCERLVSGQGISNLYRFHTLPLEGKGLPFDPDLSDEELPAMVSHSAIIEKEPLCIRILDQFCSLLGQEAGNMALKSLATGGVFLAGGIPGKILPFLLSSSFMEHFTNKGRYRKLLQDIPVRIVTNPEIGIQGALAYARIRHNQLEV